MKQVRESMTMTKDTWIKDTDHGTQTAWNGDRYPQ